MSQAPANSETTPVTPRHYQALSLVGLGAACVVHVQQGLHLSSAAAVVIGVASILLRARFTPLLVVVVIAAGQLDLYNMQNNFVDADWRVQRSGFLNAPDVVLCVGLLAYVAGNYRLHSVWYRILPADPRRRYHADAPMVLPRDRVGHVVPPQRSAHLITPAELATLVMSLPLCAAAAQGVWYVLTARWSLSGLAPRWMIFVQIAWLTVVGSFVVGQLVRYVRRRQMGRTAARIMVQDVLWKETRREQRRVNRWLAWAKVRRPAPPAPQ